MDFGLDVLDSVGRLDLEGDGLAGERLYENLHAVVDGGVRRVRELFGSGQGTHLCLSGTPLKLANHGGLGVRRRAMCPHWANEAAGDGRGKFGDMG